MFQVQRIDFCGGGGPPNVGSLEIFAALNAIKTNVGGTHAGTLRMRVKVNGDVVGQGVSVTALYSPTELASLVLPVSVAARAGTRHVTVEFFVENDAGGTHDGFQIDPGSSTPGTNLQQASVWAIETTPTVAAAAPVYLELTGIVFTTPGTWVEILAIDVPVVGVPS